MGFFLIIGVFLLSKGVYDLFHDYERELRRQQVRGWARTKATIIDGGMRKVLENKGRMERMYYHISGEFEYRVAGKTYVSRQVTPMHQRFASEEVARKLLGQLRTGRKIHAYFNPQDHSEAYLTPGPPLISWSYVFFYLLLGFVMPLLILGILLITDGIILHPLVEAIHDFHGAVAPVMLIVATFSWYAFTSYKEKATILEDFPEPKREIPDQLILEPLEAQREPIKLPR